MNIYEVSRDLLKSMNTGCGRLPRPDFSALIPRKNSVLIDLHQAADFAQWNLPSAINFPLASLTASTPTPFSNPSTLDHQWRELESLVERDKEMASHRGGTSNSDSNVPPEQELLAPSSLHGRKVTLLCYNGDTARVATSVLRAREMEAYSI